MSLATEYVKYSREVEYRAKEVESMGIMAMDALHIACSEKAKSDFFITCDDWLVSKCKMHRGELKVRVMGLMEFVSKEVLRS